MRNVWVDERIQSLVHGQGDLAPIRGHDDPKIDDSAGLVSRNSVSPQRALDVYCRKCIDYLIQESLVDSTALF